MNVHIFKVINRFYLSPYRLQVLCIHKSHFCQQAAEADLGSKIDKRGTQTETWQTYLAALIGLECSFPKVQHFLAWFYGN